MMKKRKYTNAKLRIRRKNPKNLSKEQILNILSNNSDIQDLQKIGSGGEADVYYINVIKITHIFDKLIKKGEYAVKIYEKNPRFDLLTEKQQKYLILLSKYGLIPEIFYIDSNVMIMKYIRGFTLYEFFRKINDDPIIIEQLKQKYLNLLKVWKKLGFVHGDIKFSKMYGNILVTDNLKLYIIDPFRGPK